MGDGPDGHVSHQPFRSVRTAPGLAAADWPAVHAGALPHSAALPIRPASAVLRLSARVLDDAHDDAGASGLCSRYNRLHRPRDSIRGKGSCVGAWRGLRGISTQSSDVIARTSADADAGTSRPDTEG